VTGLGPLRTRLQRSGGRGFTKFVGRQREMDAMRHAAEQAKAGHGQIVAAMCSHSIARWKTRCHTCLVCRELWKVETP
jgi:hypothetical protein